MNIVQNNLKTAVTLLPDKLYNQVATWSRLAGTGGLVFGHKMVKLNLVF